MKLIPFSLLLFILFSISFGVTDTQTTTQDESATSTVAPEQPASEEADDFSNPFTQEAGISEEGAEKQTIKPSDKKEKKPPFWYKYNFGKKYVTTLQKTLNVKVSQLVHEFKENMSFGKAFWVFIICFIYAILHTGGPGHGKLILGTYFLTDDSKRKKSDAAIAGIIVSLTHNGMAVLLSGLLYLFIHSFGDQRHMQEVAKRIGGIFVIVTGIVIMLTTLFRDKIKFFDEKKSAEKLKKYPLYIIAILSGIVPCPLAWTVLVLCITIGLYWLGLLAVFGMALGAGLTVGTTGYIILAGKEKLFSFVNKDRAEFFAHILRFCGGLFLVVFGYLMTQVV